MPELIEYSDIIGSMGGGGGGKAHTPVEYKDTLGSNQTVRVLFAINDGEIEGVEQIYLNRTPISDFSGASWEFRPGTNDQSVIPGFSETEAPIQGFNPVEIKTDASYTRSVDYDVTAVRVTLTVPSLQRVEDDGDIVGHSVMLVAYTKNTAEINETLIFAQEIKKKGKSSGPYSWDVRIERPAGAVTGQQWQFVIVRASADETSVKRSNKTQITGVTEIRHHAIPLTYPNTALIAITLRDAEQFGGRVPEVTFKIKGTKVFLPNNYYPDSRIYDGPWTYGEFNTLYRQWTDNPVWILLHVLTEKMKVPHADIDLGSFYNEAMYADQLIDDGKGGTEPRFTINNQFIQRENPPTFLMYLLTLVNGQFSDNEFGQIKLVTDRAGRAVTKVVNNTNVVDGEFVYSSNDLESRFSLVNVTYNNPYQMGDTATTTVENSNLVTRYGLQTSDIVLAGCYSEAAAIRKARWAVWVNAYDTEMVSFSVGLAGMNYHIGELVKVQDDRNFGFDHQGLIQSASNNGTTTTLTLDRAVELGTESYTVTFLSSDGATVVTQTIQQSNGTFSTLTFTSVNMPMERSPFTLETTTKKPLIGRVISIKKDGDTYGITCVRHNEQKYAYIEGAVSAPPPTADFINLANLSVSAPVNVSVSEIFNSDGVNAYSRLRVTWDWNLSGAEKFPARFQVLWRRDNQSYNSITDLPGKEYDIENPVPGQYDIIVYAVNPISNMKSAGSTLYVYNYRNDVAQSSLDPVLNVYVQGTNGLTFSAADLVLDIQHNPANDEKPDKLLDYVVEVWTVSGTAPKNTYVIKPDANKNGLFKFSYVENIAVFGVATRQFQLKVYCRDMVGDLSAAKAVTVNNPAPSISAFDATSSFSAAYLKVTTTELDVVGFRFKRYANASGGAAKDFIDSKSNIIDYKLTSAEAGTLWYYSATAIDAFGAGIETSRTGVTAVVLEPDTFTYVGLTFAPVKASNQVTWSSFQAYKNGVLNTSVNAGSATWTSGTLYLYMIPGNVTLQQTTSATTAIAAGGRILATYKGGSDLTHDFGKAFISGDQLIAGSLLSSALATNTAYITNFAQIGNVLQSDGYNWQPGVAASGWRIDKDGWIQAASITIRNTNGQVVFSSNTGTEWQYVANRPTSLSGLNATDGGKLAGIQANATKNEIFRQATAPTGGTYTTGDLWFDTDSAKGELYQWSGTQWSLISNTISNTNQIADGAGLGATAVWSGVSGAGKPESNATYGADGSNLNIAIGGNVFPNSDFNSPNVDKWFVGWNQGGGTNYYIGRDHPNPDWCPAGGHTIGFSRGGTTGAASGHFDIEFSQNFYVDPGGSFEVSAYLSSHRCTAQILILWFNSSNTHFDTSSTGVTTPDNGGRNLNNWNRLGGIYTAPGSAAYARVRVRGMPTTSQDPYVWATKFFFARAKAGQTQLSPWQPAGASGAFSELSQITTGNASTYIANAAIGAAQIGSIELVGESQFKVRTGESGARMDMDSRRIKVFDGNGTLVIQLGDLSV